MNGKWKNHSEMKMNVIYHCSHRGNHHSESGLDKLDWRLVDYCHVCRESAIGVLINKWLFCQSLLSSDTYKRACVCVFAQASERASSKS